MGTYLDPPDLANFAEIADEKAVDMIADAEAMAMLAAPCLSSQDLTEAQKSALRAILRGAILRWNEAGTGAFQSQTTGPYGAVVDTRQQRRAMFWPSEIAQMRDVCSMGVAEQPAAFAIDTAPVWGNAHQPWCSLNLGALFCSCGADLAGVPLYEV